jgi:hypothetical protein
MLQVGSLTDANVFINSKLYDHTVNHVYCSGLAISYNSIDLDAWDGLAEIFLNAMYENTLLICLLNNINNNTNAPCYLTKIGGGVFGMKQSQIITAIQRACQTVADKGLKIDIKIVHHGYIDKEYDDIASIITENRSNNINTKSVFDNTEWLNRYTIDN